VRIAIIGTGIAGLVAAHLLRHHHELTLFEADDHAGGHTNTIDVTLNGQSYAVDTGFIVFNEVNYPNFTALLRALSVESQPTAMSFSVRCDQTGLEYNGSSIDQLFAQRSNLLRPRFWRMLGDIRRFHALAPSLLEGAGIADDVTVEDWACRSGLGAMFLGKYLVPLGASLWSCPARTFRRFPIRFVVEFLRNHAMLQYAGRPRWRVVRGGSRQYVARLTAPFNDRIRLRTPIREVQRQPRGVILRPESGLAQTFDHAILACHADQALAMLRDPSPVEREVLAAFPYQPNEAVLHTDTRVLPRRRRAWASWNYRVGSDDADDVAVTYNMNMLQGLTGKDTFCVTLNPVDAIDPAKVIRRIRYHHPIFTSQRRAAQMRHGDLINVNRTSFCGAYWGYGFHEDGVNSAMAVCRALGTPSA
jgi:predicted NAD/FAD-binding protein